MWQGNGIDSADGIYEREHLRRLAKKLGLRLVKTQMKRSEETSSAMRPPGTRLRARAMVETNAREAAIQETELDKCG